jgi:hypothetical protein
VVLFSTARNALQRHIQQQFGLLLYASPEVWNKEVLPWLHVKLADISDRQFYAMEYIVEHDKEWEQGKEAPKVFKQLSRGDQARIRQLSQKKWHYRSQWNWDTLLQNIACDQETFLKYCENPRAQDCTRHIPESMRDRIRRHYSQQAIYLLGGGRSMPRERLFSINWRDLRSREAQRQAKKQTLHWFRHALRNMREYRYRRRPIPLTPECATACRRIQQKLCLK